MSVAEVVNLPVISSSNDLGHYMKEIRRFPMLGAEEELELARRWRDDEDVGAAHKLVTSHLRLVAKIAMGYRGYGMPISDLISEGNIGMMQAVKGFDPEKGFRLSTYAMWWIKAAIQEYILKSWSLVKIASTSVQKKLFFNLNRARRYISHLDNGGSDVDEVDIISDYLQVSKKDVVQMYQRMSGGDVSLNSPVNDDSDDEWIDWIEDSRENHGVELGEKDEMSYRRGLLSNALDELTERERDILQGRRLSEKPVTLDVLSKKYGISRERVRQIEFKAFNRIQELVLQQSAV